MPSQDRPIRLGLCCMNTTLKKQKPPVYCSRKIIVRIIDEKGIEELKRRVLDNLTDLYKMLQWNEENGIKVFRLSSEMFPHKTNPKVPDYTYDFALEHLKKISVFAKEHDMRLTFHPGQYNVLGTPNPKIVKQTIADLNYHAEVLDILECDMDSVMVIHGGGLYGDKLGAKIRWADRYNELPENIQRRLVLENCERSYSIKDCLEISDNTGVPIVFDTHHHDCYLKLHPDEEFEPVENYIKRILDTWTNGRRPKFHVSEQGTGKIGHHSDYIEIIPDYLLNIPEKYGIKIDIMIEAKMKELSIQKLYEKYPQLNCKII